MRNLILIILLYSSFLKAQTTAIPDPNFEQALINLGHDTGSVNGFIINSNVSSVIGLDIDSMNITDLTGIEAFSSLILLDCSYNKINNLNLGLNYNLEVLLCHDNSISTINVIPNYKLRVIKCYNNFIAELDLSQNYLIDFIDCSSNLLTCLNIKNGNNVNTYLKAINNPNLLCIDVDNISWSSSNWVSGLHYDGSASFSINCGNTCSTVGIEETSNLATSFYPNPTTGIVNIDLRETKSNLKATLLNSLGQVVYSKNYPSVNYINLNIDSPKGVYFLQLESEREIQTLKILKE